MVERRGKLERAVAADAAPARLQSGQAVGGAGPADRTAGVGAERAEAKSGSRRDRRAAGRDTRPVARIPRILRRFHQRMVIGIGALGELHLAEDDGARVLEPAHDGCICTGTKVAMKRGACRRRNALGPEQVLERNRHAMQGPPIPALRDVGVRGFRLGHGRFRHHVNVAAEIAVDGVDPVELRARHLQRRDFARLEVCRERGEFEIVQGVGHGSVLHSGDSRGVRPRGIVRHQYE